MLRRVASAVLTVSLLATLVPGVALAAGGHAPELRVTVSCTIRNPITPGEDYREAIGVGSGPIVAATIKDFYDFLDLWLEFCRPGTKRVSVERVHS